MTKYYVSCTSMNRACQHGTAFAVLDVNCLHRHIRVQAMAGRPWQDWRYEYIQVWTSIWRHIQEMAANCHCHCQTGSFRPAPAVKPAPALLVRAGSSARQLGKARPGSVPRDVVRVSISHRKSPRGKVCPRLDTTVPSFPSARKRKGKEGGEGHGTCQSQGIKPKHVVIRHHA